MSAYKFLLYGSQFTIGISGILIISGVILIKRGYKELHRKAMIFASLFALLFVIMYLIRSSFFPHIKYRGNHRGLYLFTLWSHTFLSVVNLPLVIDTLYLAFKNRFEKHKKVAPYTAAIWIYVAGTGWLIFFFLRG